MYNSDLKKRYIMQRAVDKRAEKTCINLFNSVSVFEQEYSVDVCCMTQAQLQSVVDAMFGAKYKSRITQFTVLHDYIKWCIAIGVDGACNNISGIDIYGIDRMRTMTVTCPLALNELLNTMYSPESTHTMDNVYRCFLWLAYSGMKESDALLVKVKNVRFDLMTIEYKGQSYPIYPESIAAFRCCATLKEFYYDHPNYNDDVKVFKKRVPGNLLLRGVRTQPQSQVLRTELNKRIKASISSGRTRIKISYTRAWLSGVFYRMYSREMAGFPVDFEGFVDELINNSFISPSISYAAAKKKARDYMVDYERWKLTFK